MYPTEHYPRWVRDVPQHAGVLVAGGFGENMTVAGLDEDSVSIGDVLRVGTAELQVTQPRQPCFKLALRFDDSSLGRIMMQTGRTGWYVRVLESGSLQTGDEIRVHRRPNPQWTIARFSALILSRQDSKGEFAKLAVLEGLAEVWKQTAEEALQETDEF